MATPGKSSANLLDTIVSLCKRRGFVYPSGEIYGGTRSAWDYGPLGVELKENVKKQWWRHTVTTRDDVVGLDSSVILPTRTREASGHLKTFSRATRGSGRTTCRRTTRARRASTTPTRWTSTNWCRVPTAATARRGPSPVSST